ncbi:MAG: T6SS effector amidase Tae4 family protein [Minicystis sp.]
MTTKTLTSFQRMWHEYPDGTAEEVKARIGGAVDADWVTNTCVIRVSRSFNYAGFPLPVKYPGFTTLKGADGLRYGLRVREFKAYLRAEYGPPQVSYTYPGQSGEVPAVIMGRRGILCFDVSGWSDATGHFNLWNGERCINHGYFDRASAVHLWEVSEGEPVPTGKGATRAQTAKREITASVGAGGVNKPEDVRVVQELLAARGVYTGPVDGTVTPALIDSIKAFQRRFATWPDGRIDVGGRTLRELQGL